MVVCNIISLMGNNYAIFGYNYMQEFKVTSNNPQRITYENYDIGCSHRNKARVVRDKCTGSREHLERFVVYDPRSEYTQNLYHAMEEVYSLHQTAWLLGLNLSDVELVLVRPYKILPRLKELFEMVVAKVSIRSHFAGCCVQPLRACTGSFLPYTWSYHKNVQPATLSLDVRRHLLATLHLHPNNRFLLMTRRHARSRRLVRVMFFYNCMRWQGETVVLEGLSQMTMMKQIQMVAESRALVGPHGAGLTLSMFLPLGGALVEITDANPTNDRSVRSVHNIYHNIAEMTDHYYTAISAHEKDCNPLRHVLQIAKQNITHTLRSS